MNVSVSDAKAQLTDLVKRAEAGDEIVLTRHGQPVARLVPVQPKRLSNDELRKALEDIGRRGKAQATPGPCAARSQDFLYDEFGLPK